MLFRFRLVEISELWQINDSVAYLINLSFELSVLLSIEGNVLKVEAIGDSVQLPRGTSRFGKLRKDERSCIIKYLQSLELWGAIDYESIEYLMTASFLSTGNIPQLVP
jgi:hypothetical protein